MRSEIILWVLSEHEGIDLDIIQSTLVYLAKLGIGCVAFPPSQDFTNKLLWKPMVTFTFI